MKKFAFVIGICVSALGGCAGVQVTPQIQSTITNQYQNVVAVNNKIQADATVSPDAKNWFKSEVESWKYLNDWVNGVNPTPAK